MFSVVMSRLLAAGASLGFSKQERDFLIWAAKNHLMSPSVPSWPGDIFNILNPRVTPLCYFDSSVSHCWLSGSSVVKNPPADAGDRRLGFNPWVKKTIWIRKCSPLQYSCLGNLMDRGAWLQSMGGGGHKESKMPEHRCAHAHTHTHTHTHQLSV